MVTEVIEAYFPSTKNYSIEPFGNGHINDTFKLFVEGKPSPFILQRINKNIFADPQNIINTQLQLQKLILNRNSKIKIPEIIPNINCEHLTVDLQGNAWRLIHFFSESYTIELAKYNWQAKQAGIAYGWFVKECSMLNVNCFKEAIKDFHCLSFRICQLNDSIKNNLVNRLELVKDIVEFYKEREGKLQEIENLVEEGGLPIRVVHNDTKINNLLFRGKHVVAVIDLDTVGPGLLNFDYGDAVRTLTNEALEDEKDLNKVRFNIKLFKAFTEGYMNQVKSFITDAEKENLFIAPILMTYIMGIRFLTDFLNGDQYYKIAYPEHNIVRSKVQMNFIKSLEENLSNIRTIIFESLP
jgi:thiamine kinase-like enzyme